MTLRALTDQLNMNPRVLAVFHNHSLRVMHLSTRLATRLGVRSRNLTLAALLHDVGKVGITADVILKPGALTNLEFAVVQGHSQMGQWLCKEFLDNPTAGLFIRHHHERWDGRGYPDGVAGHAIPLESRIISVCDVFDTLVSEERPYRKMTWSVPDAFAELRRCAGAQFDKNVVEALVAMITERPSVLSPRGRKASDPSLSHEPNRLIYNHRAPRNPTGPAMLEPLPG